MNRTDINKIMSLLRDNYPKEYKRFKVKGEFITHNLSTTLCKKGFDNYKQLKEACPAGVKLGYFIVELLKD